MIAAEYFPYVFDRFYRIDSSRSWEMVVFGPGLALWQAFAEAHGVGLKK